MRYEQKQRITPKQLEKLDEQQIHVLRNLYTPHEGDMIYDEFSYKTLVIMPKPDEDFDANLYEQMDLYTIDTIDTSTILPLLTIGQMFEILGLDRWLAPEITYGSNLEFVVYIDNIEEGKTKERYSGDCLCDVLWEALKQDLKRRANKNGES